MRIARQAFAGLPAEAEKLLLAEPAFGKRTRIDTGRTVALDRDQVAAMVLRRCMPEMAETNSVECCGRLEACNVTAELRALLWRAARSRARSSG